MISYEEGAGGSDQDIAIFLGNGCDERHGCWCFGLEVMEQ
jgi:hypothetical protein